MSATKETLHDAIIYGQEVRPRIDNAYVFALAAQFLDEEMLTFLRELAIEKTRETNELLGTSANHHDKLAQYCITVLQQRGVDCSAAYIP